MRLQIKKTLLSELKAHFHELDFTSSHLEPKDKIKLFVSFPKQDFSVFCENPRIFDAELTCEIDFLGFIPKANPNYFELLLSRLLSFLEKKRFLNGLVLNSEIISVESGEDLMDQKPSAYTRIILKYFFKTNLLEEKID